MYTYIFVCKVSEQNDNWEALLEMVGGGGGGGGKFVKNLTVFCGWWRYYVVEDTCLDLTRSPWACISFTLQVTHTLTDSS